MSHYFELLNVVPYIGTWIETTRIRNIPFPRLVVPYIGTWIETSYFYKEGRRGFCRTLYRYVD